MLKLLFGNYQVLGSLLWSSSCIHPAHKGVIMTGWVTAAISLKHDLQMSIPFSMVQWRIFPTIAYRVSSRQHWTWNVFKGQHKLPPFSTSVAKLLCHRSFWLCKSSSSPTPISHYLNINGKPFKFMGGRKLLLTIAQ